MEIKRRGRDYTVYPVIRKDRPYVVCLTSLGPQYYAEIYAYNSVKKLFKGHKGDLLYIKLIDNIIPVKNSTLYPDFPECINLSQLEDTEFRVYMSDIMRHVFLKYEKQKLKEEQLAQKLASAEKWDGVVE